MERKVLPQKFARGGEIGSRGESAVSAVCP
jgi:hypothetical protein